MKTYKSGYHSDGLSECDGCFAFYVQTWLIDGKWLCVKCKQWYESQRVKRCKSRESELVKG